LTQRPKWRSSGVPFAVGDTVLIADGTEPRNSWPIGKIVATFPGKDNKVRVVDVQTENGILRRPVHKLALLPEYTGDNDRK